MSSTGKQLTVENLEVAAAGSPLLSGVSLTVEPGEFVALVGSSGSGKTLTAMSCLQLLPAGVNVTGGSVSLGGLDLTRASEHELNAVRGGSVGMLFQQPKRMFNPNRTIEQHLSEPLRLHGGLRGTKARAKAVELLAEVGFTDPEGGIRAYPHQLSGGMAQRAMTALALAGKPHLLLADEPTSALDTILERQIMTLLDRERQERGLGILYITHNIASVAAYADRILVMRSGRIVESGPTADLLARPQQDYTRELLAAARLASEQPPGPSSSASAAAAASAITTTATAAAVASPAERDVLVLAAVGKRFGSRRRPGPSALDNVSLALRRGEILGILGQSGSGKSTLAKAVVGLETIDTGSITRHLDAAGSRQPTAVQLVFQEPHGAFDPRMTLRSSLQAPLRNRRGRTPDALEDQLTAALHEVELDADLLDKRPGQCSGGQLQRATIARALLLKPQILICDEATSALDALTQLTILNLLLRLRREHDLSLVIVSHDLDVVQYMCDRIAVLQAGQVVEVSRTRDFFAQPQHPHSQELVHAYQARTQDVAPHGSLPG